MEQVTGYNITNEIERKKNKNEIIVLIECAFKHV